jgi:hypothetical protein
MSRHPDPVSVRGGAGGIAADVDEMLAMARRFGAAAHDTLAAAFQLHGYLFDFGNTVSALLDPVGYAQYEADLLDALDGLHGLTWLGAHAGVIDGELRVAANAYEQADRLSSDVHETVTALIGAPPALIAAAGELGRSGNPIAAAQAALVRDPEVADIVVDALGISATLAVLAGRIPDGHGVVRNPGVDAFGVAALPPRRLTDLIRNLAQRSGQGPHGEIDVRILTMPDGSRRAIVDITGTKSWDPLPTSDITSLTTNGRALVGRRTAYEQGVLAAMRTAGVRRTDHVMIVGHSEGGMVAVTTARDATRSGEFDVTHVVTAGAPIGQSVAGAPGRVQVLALENRTDVIPHLDGTANPDRPNVTTASGERGDRTVRGDHDLTRSYLPLAGDVQASQHRSVREFLHTARGYFGATQVVTHTYQIVRR